MIHYRLQIYEADDETVMVEFGTEPDHPLPYLHVPTEYAEAEIDLLRGSATIGQLNFAISDHPTIPGDQASGAVTAILADAGGYTAAMGRRCRMLVNYGSGYATLQDGIVDSVRLRPSYAGYDFQTRDIRERERRTAAFTCAALRDLDGVLTDAPCIVPRGRLRPYGAYPNGNGWLIPAVTPAIGWYHGDLINGQAISFPAVDEDDVPVERIITPKMRAALKVEGAFELINATLLWRDVGASEWNETRGVIPRHTDNGPLLWGKPGKFRPPGGGDPIDVEYLHLVHWDWAVVFAGPIPTQGQQVEMVIVWTGEPTADYPLRWEGTAGDLLAMLYDGRFSLASGELTPSSSRIWYDPVAVAALTTPLRLTREAPVSNAKQSESADGAKKTGGLRAWAEKHVYAVLGAAPAIDRDGRISPVQYALPGPDVEVAELNNSNCKAVPGWEHSSSDAINRVTVKYVREYGIAATADPLQERSTSDGVAYRAVSVSATDDETESDALLGAQTLEIEAETLRAIGGPDGRPISGDVTDEQGHQVAQARARQALDRFVLGGQHFVVLASRDPEVEAIVPGKWAIEGTSWKPDYGTGRRGANRLVQVISRRDVSPAWTELTMSDAGPAAQPLGQPTLGTPTADAAGIVSIPFTALAAGSQGAAYYAVAPSLPANGSGLWTAINPRASVPGTVTTPALAAGVVVWIRARGEAAGRRPSAYTNAVSLALPETPRLLSASVVVSGTTATVLWMPNAFAANVRVAYSVHLPSALPTYASTINAAASAGEVALPVAIAPGYEVSVRIEPWAGAVGDGDPGPLVYARGRAPAATASDFAIYNVRKGGRSESGVVVTYETGARVTEVHLRTLVLPQPHEEDTQAAVLATVPVEIVPGGMASVTLPIPPWQHELYAALTPYGADLQEGASVYLDVDPLDPEPPVLEHDKREQLLGSDYVGTRWFKVRERGLPVVSVGVTTQIGREPPSALVAPARAEGDTSVVRGGVLGAGEYESDVLILDRLSYIRPVLTLATGEVMTIETAPFDRNHLPTIRSIDIEGTTARCTGDTEVGSWTASHGVWSEARDGEVVAFVGIPVPEDEQWEVTFVARNVPLVGIGSDGELAVTETRIVRGSGAAADPYRPTWRTAPLLAAPAAGDAAVTVTLDARAQVDGAPDLSTYTVHVWERHNTGGAWSEWLDVTADMDPAPTSPVATPSAHTYTASRTRSADGSVPYTIEIRAEIVDALLVVQDARAQALTYYVTGRTYEEPT